MPDEIRDAWERCDQVWCELSPGWRDANQMAFQTTHWGPISAEAAVMINHLAELEALLADALNRVPEPRR